MPSSPRWKITVPAFQRRHCLTNGTARDPQGLGERLFRRQGVAGGEPARLDLGDEAVPQSFVLRTPRLAVGRHGTGKVHKPVGRHRTDVVEKSAQGTDHFIPVAPRYVNVL